MKPPLFPSLLLLALCLLVSCKPAAEKKENVFDELHGVRIAATTPVIADLIRQIGGVRVKVDCLIPVDGDPLAFVVTPEIRQRLETCWAIFHTQLPEEQKILAEIATLRHPLGIYPLGTQLAPKSLIPRRNGQTGDDPFFWGNVSLWQQCIDPVLAGLGAVDPEGREVYEQNAEFYREKLAALHQWALRRAQEVAPEKKIILTTRNGLTYFGTAYFFDTGAIEVPERVGQAVELIKQRKLRAVFSEAGVPRDLIDQVAAGAGLPVAGPLYIYGPGKPGTAETSQGESYTCDNYIGMIKHNINTCVEALK